MDDRNHQTFRHGAGLRSLAAQMGRDRLYNVAKLGFEWSLFIERRGRRGRPRLATVSRDWQASQFVTGDSVSSQKLMPHRRPNVGSPADGGAHGPTHGSPSAGAGSVPALQSMRRSRICPGLRVQILETDSDAVYPDWLGVAILRDVTRTPLDSAREIDALGKLSVSERTDLLKALQQGESVSAVKRPTAFQSAN